MIPNSIGLNEGNGPGFANLQAIRLGPPDSATAIRTSGPGKAELLEARLQIFPGCFTVFAPAAFLLFGHCAKENMALDRSPADGSECLAGSGQILA